MFRPIVERELKMTYAKKKFIKNYIEKLNDGLASLATDYEAFPSEGESYLFDVIMETRNVFSEVLPQIEDVILLRKGTATRDANSVLGILRLYLIDEEEKFKNAGLSVETKEINVVDSEYIRSIIERANSDISQGNYDSAITKCRTLLEEVFCQVIELQKLEPGGKGDIGKLYKQVKDLYDMHGDKSMDNRVNMLLSGLEKIISAVAEMRNSGSDSHGLGSKRIDIDDYHARLFMNASVTMAEFILAVGVRNKKSESNG